MVPSDQLQQFLQAVRGQDEASRRQAIQTMKQIEEPDWASVPGSTMHSLVEELEHQLLQGTKQISIRQQILKILGNFGPAAEPAVPTLIDLLKDGVPDGIREEAATALGKIGKKAKPAAEYLYAMLPGCRTTLAVRVILALSGIVGADQKVRNALTELWATPDQSQISLTQIALALCKLKVEARGLLVFLIRSLMANQDSALRQLAAEALAHCDKNEIDVVPSLLYAALHDKDEKVRIKAEAGLTQLRLSREQAIRVCSRQLKESVYAEGALRNSGQEAVPALIEALGASEPACREKAARTLGCLGELAVAAVPALTVALRDKHPDIRLAAAKCLWNVTKDAEAPVPVLVGLLEESSAHPTESSDARRQFLQTVIEALWRIGPPARLAIPALKKKAKDSNRLISESALSALKSISPPVVVKAGK